MIEFIRPDWPAPATVRALTTTRSGGCSTGAFTGLNLADHVGDDRQAVAANRRCLREALPGLPADPLWLNQVHGRHCVLADSAVPGVTADASVCRDDRHVCAVLTADCLPLLLCDDSSSVVAAAHAGWRGLAGGVIEAAVAAMDCPPEKLLAWLGPAIGPQAFEVGEEVRAAFTARDAAAQQAFMECSPGKYLCDLYLLTRQRLAGIGVGRVYGGGFCTHAEAGRFFSYRRDGRTGRMASLIWIERPGARV